MRRAILWRLSSRSIATPQQREIREVFPAYYCVRAEDLLFALSKLTNQNKKGEYYLTDIYGILRKAGKKVIAVQAVTPEDVIAPEQAAAACGGGCGDAGADSARLAG